MTVVVVGKIAEAVLSVPGMNVWCTCKQAWLDERRGPLEPRAHCDMKVVCCAAEEAAGSNTQLGLLGALWGAALEDTTGSGN